MSDPNGPLIFFISVLAISSGETKEKTELAAKVKVKTSTLKPEIKKRGLVGVSEQKPKSRTRLFGEKYPEGIESEIVNMRAVLR